MAAESEFNIYQHFPSVSCFSRVFNWSCHLFSSVLPPGADTLRAEHLQISGWTSDLFCKHFKQITEIKDILGNYISLMESTNILSLDTFVDMYQSF